MNNKGFAISTMLYGLSIIGLLLAVVLVKTVATSRGEQRKLVEAVENELNDYETISKFFSYDDRDGDPNVKYNSETGAPNADTGTRKYKLPATGWYKIELWGSAAKIEQEGVDDDDYDYGNIVDTANAGSYSTVTAYLKEGTTLYIYLGNETRADLRPTTICNAKDRCTSGTNLMFTSAASFTPKTASFVDIDADDEDQFNNLKNEGTDYKTETIYYGNKVNISDRGMARISLVSVQKATQYKPIRSPYGLVDGKNVFRAGVFYILDARNGTALTAKESLSTSAKERAENSVEFITLDGDDTQKWRYDPKESSLINVRTNYSLRAVGPCGQNVRVMSDDTFSNRAFEKWSLVKPANANLNALTINNADYFYIKGSNGSTPYFFGHNRSNEASDDYSDEALLLRSSESPTAPAAKFYNYKYFFINAY